MLCSFWCELAVRGTALTGFSLVPPLAVTDCLHELSVDALCKWPNDVRWRGRKLCGILTQCLTGRDIVLGAVVGVGLNIKDAPDLPGSSSAPVCLQEILGFAPDVETLATAIGSCLMERKKRWLAGERAAQLNEWLEQCDHKETEVRVTIGGQRVSGIMRGLGPQGQLLFEHDGRVDEVWADDIVPLA